MADGYVPLWDFGASSAGRDLTYRFGSSGYFLRAYLTFDTLAGAGRTDPTSTFHHIYEHLSRHRAHISSDPWAGLPELTNENGAYCHDSCRTQAWSGSTLLDALDDMAKMAATKKTA